MTQNQRVLDHLIDHGYITPLVASSYGVTRLAARIKDLKEQGVGILNNVEQNAVGVRYSRYTLQWPAAERARRIFGMGWRL